MSNLILTFNGPATAAMGTNTRLRVKSMKRGGQEFVALRPSYRVSGKNAMVRTVKTDDGMFSAELPEAMMAELNLPELKSTHTDYLMDDAGYGWFLLRGDFEAGTDLAIVTVSKVRKSSKKAKSDDDTSSSADSTNAGGDAKEVQDSTSSGEPSGDAPNDAGEDNGGRATVTKKLTGRAHGAKHGEDENKGEAVPE